MTSGRIVRLLAWSARALRSRSRRCRLEIENCFADDEDHASTPMLLPERER